jgi:hypothetical protein
LEQIKKKDRSFDFLKVFSLEDKGFKKPKNNTFGDGMRKWLME